MTLFRGRGDGTLEVGRSFRAESSPHQIVVRNLDRDGSPDVVLIDGRRADVLVMRGDGAGGYCAPLSSPLGAYP